MGSEQGNESSPADLIQCPYHTYGCTDLFPRHQSSQHFGSEKHIKIDLAMNPFRPGESLPAAAIIKNNFEQYIGRSSNDAIETFQPSNSTNIVSSESSSLDQIYTTTDFSPRNLIEQTDRTSNQETNRRLHQAERELNATAMNDTSNRIAPSSTNEQQSTVEFYKHNIGILQTDLNSKPASTDGCLIWHLKGIYEKIDDAIRKKPPFINSEHFLTSMGGHRLYARLYLVGNTDPRFISLHVHLDFPVNDSFRGTIKVILVDQSENDPLQHELQSCTGEITAVNGRLGWEQLIDKNVLQYDASRFVLDDSIYILIVVEQTAREKIANLPKNVQDALMLLR